MCFASEWDKEAAKTYFENYGIKPYGDITKIKEESIPPHDMLCGGFPCQAFSISGKQKGFEDTRGTLFFDVARIIKHHNPKVLQTALQKSMKLYIKFQNSPKLRIQLLKIIGDLKLRLRS